MGRKIKRFSYLLALLLAAILFSARSAAVADFLAGNVVFEKEIPPGEEREADRSATLVYILGGNQDNLLSRFTKASALYRRGVAGKIHVLSRPGITEFSPELRRNLTNDEWSARELEKLEVEKGDVVPVRVEPSFYGTLAEARRVSGLIREAGCRRLVLVSSFYHTRRSYDSFRAFLSDTPVEIYVYRADGRAGFVDLAVENFKLLVYDRLLIPAYAGKRRWNS